MPLDLFGYNGVFELDESVVNKLVGVYLYDRHLVRVDGNISDGDFLAATVPAQGGEDHLYFELARPFLHVQTKDGSDIVSLHLPVADLGRFGVNSGVVSRLPKFPITIALVLFDLPVAQNASSLSVDFSQLTADKVGIESIDVQPGPTGVGGQQTKVNALLDDATMRQQIADYVKGGGIPPINVPVSPGGLGSAMRSWDLLLFGNANDRDLNDQPGPAGADFLLYEDANNGRGYRLQAGQTLPPAPENPQYTWSVSAAAQVLLDSIARALDHGPYFIQDGAINTPANPLGYLVVPAAGSTAYWLPSGPKIAVSAPQDGQATVTIASGGLTPHSRARLRNLTRNREMGFTADSSGATTQSIGADPGERLGLAVDAVSIPNNSSIVVWRPQITFADNQLNASAHYYVYIPNWCDWEADFTIQLRLYADRTRPFKVGVEVINADSSAPGWAYLSAWAGSQLVGLDIFAPVVTGLVPVIVQTVAISLAQDGVGELSDSLRSQIAAPSLDNLVLTLDQVDVHESGLQLSGRADSGMVVAWDRTVGYSTQPGLALRDRLDRPLGAEFTWAPSITTISITGSSRYAVVTDAPPDHFWAATYDDLPPDSAFGRSPFSLNAGDSALVWAETPDGPAKVLFSRAVEAGSAPSTGMIVTWIAYRGRVHRSVDLVNHVKATVVGGRSNPVLESRYYRYDGTVDLTTTKFFLSNDTLAVGDEHWFFDNQPVTQDAGISAPGLTVVLDAPNRRLNIHVDQSGLFEAGQIQQYSHVIRFEGIDVFGNSLETSLTIETNPYAFFATPLAPDRPFAPIPIGDPFRDRGLVDLLRAMSDIAPVAPLDPAAIANLIRSLGPTSANGSVVLSRAQADTILSLLLGTGPGSQRGQIG